MARGQREVDVAEYRGTSVDVEGVVGLAALFAGRCLATTAICSEGRGDLNGCCVVAVRVVVQSFLPHGYAVRKFVGVPCAYRAHMDSLSNRSTGKTARPSCRCTSTPLRSEKGGYGANYSTCAAMHAW